MKLFRPNFYFRYGIPIAAILLLALFLGQFQAEINPTTVALAFLLVILASATFFGRNPALLASFAAMLCFNYYFLEPFFTWHIADSSNLVAWGTFTLTAIIAGELSAYARRRAEEAEERKIEIERLYNELQTAFEKASQAEALRQSEKLKSSLLDAVTHDLRTPLTSIKASVSSLLEDRREKLLDEEGRTEFLEIIDEETDRLNEFIESIVGIAKVEANALHLRKSRSAVEEIVGHALARAKNLLNSYRVSVDVDDALPSVFVDAASLSEVIYTLLDNAAKYSPPHSTIRVEARQIAADAIEISVEDEGRGIAPEMQEKVFDKFFRVAEKDIHTTGSGLGLGLAIARGIVESQGGSIRIEDARGPFATRFVVRIPIEYGNEKNTGR